MNAVRIKYYVDDGVNSRWEMSGLIKKPIPAKVLDIYRLNYSKVEVLDNEELY